LVDSQAAKLSVRRQCGLLGLSRSSFYYEPVRETPENLALMRQIDELYLAWPFMGSRQLADQLGVNRKRVQRLMRQMGLEAIYPKPRTTRRGRGHKIYPYLLRNLEVVRVNQVWASDITYVPLQSGFMYLTVVLDWYSRYVLSWRLSNSLDGDFCLQALEEALPHGPPEIFNTDQGSQYTAVAFTGRLEAAGVAISMDGRGRALDNVFVERLWRTVKYENVYLKDYAMPCDLEAGLTTYWDFYCYRRRHQSLGRRTPAEVYWAGYMGREGARCDFARKKGKVLTYGERYSATASARDL
jgi:putative transposase